MRGVTFHEEAATEAYEAAQYYEERAFGLGLSFLGEVEEAVEQVVANPEAYQLIGNGVRHKLLRRQLGGAHGDSRAIQSAYIVSFASKGGGATRTVSS